MSIATHSNEITMQANGSTHNLLRMFDQDGKQYMISYFAPSGVDLNVLASSKIAAFDAALAEMEFEQLVGIG